MEAQANPQRMLLEIPLTEGERAAVEDGVVAVEDLITRLADTPTPAGPTPRELQVAFIPVATLDPQARRKRHDDVF